MPDGGKPLPGDLPYKPTLKDQHWRASLRHKPSAEAEREMETAIEKNDRWRFLMLLQLRSDWAQKDNVLQQAVTHGRFEMFQEITRGSQDWQNTGSAQRLAGQAADAGQLDFVKLFVEKCGVDIHYYSDELLRTAAKNGHEEIVEYLLSKGADHNAWNGDPMRDACENGHLGVVKKLLAAGADVNAGNPLERAARQGSKDLVEFLLSKGADIAAGNNEAFIAACRYGHADIVTLLLDKGVPANVGDSESLVTACENKFFNIASLLIKGGADINAQHGRALRLASYRGETETVQFLLDNGANPNLSQYRETPLTEAVRSGQRATVRLLLLHGAEPGLLEFEALRIARRDRNRDMQHAIVDGARAARQHEQDVKHDEFRAAFPSAYTVDDLRARKGPSGDTGLLLAARSGKFADIIRKAKGGGLLPDDLFHPDDQLDSVMSVLVRTKTLQQFFDPAFWVDRTGAVADAYESLPGHLQKRVKLDSIRAQINHRVIMQKAKGAGTNGRKPPKIGGY